MADAGDALNCTAPSGSISVDSDIVGGGVLAAFFISALFTIGAVIFGYLSGCLGDELVDELDQEKIAWLRRKLRASMAAVRRILRRSATVAADRTDGEPELDRDAHRSRASKKAIAQFILALSDQQLVTGFAILISAVSNQNRLTLYEFSVALSLAWFSSTTHLVTLGALQTYLRANRLVRHLRVVGMVAVLVLLLYASAITFAFTSSNTPNTVPVRCFFIQDYNLDGDQSTGAGAFIGIAVLRFIISPYLTRIWSLYFDFEIGDLDPLSLLQCPPRPTPRKLLPPEDGDELTPTQCLTILKAESRAKSIRRLLWYPSWLPKVMAWCLLDSRTPLTSSSASVAFSLAYGVSQVISNRLIAAPLLEADASYMGFGQFMALFLLALPFSAAVEFYYDYTENSSQLTDCNHSLQADTQDADSEDPVGKRKTATKFDDTFSDGRITNPEYVRCREDVAKYLPFEAYIIRRYEARITTLGDTDKKKLDEKVKCVLDDYRRLKKYRQELSVMTLVILWFGYMSLLALCGALLSLSMLSNTDAGLSFFIFSFSIPYLVLFTNSIDVVSVMVWRPRLRHGCKRGWTWFIRGRERTRRQADAATSAEGSQTLRRTVTALAEEGRLGERQIQH